MVNSSLQLSVILLMVLALSSCSSSSGEMAQTQSTTALEVAAAPMLEPHADDSLKDGSIAYLRIKHHLVECEGYQVGHCMLIQREGSSEWTYFYDQIEGFHYQWGAEYEILVHIRTIATNLADVSNQRYSLLEVVSETAHESSETFTYTSRHSHDRIVEIAPRQFSLLGNKIFTCSEYNCNTVRSAIEQNHSVVLTLQHNTNPAEPLVLQEVLCSDAPQSFSASCV